VILFHGSNMEVSRIDLSRCTKYKDFGQGFYTTSIREQACEWAKKVTRRFSFGKPTLSIYKFDENSDGLRHLSFTEPDEKWATFVINNRNRNFSDHGDVLELLRNFNFARASAENAFCRPLACKRQDLLRNLWSFARGQLSNHDNKYDFVRGLVANDDISAILDTFLMGILPLSEISKALIYKKLNDQYSFHTPGSLALLNFLESEAV